MSRRYGADHKPAPVETTDGPAHVTKCETCDGWLVLAVPSERAPHWQHSPHRDQFADSRGLLSGEG